MDDVLQAYADLARACDTVVQQAERVRAAIAREAGIQRPAIEIIQEIVARRHGLSREGLSSPSKKAHIVLPRQTAMWLCRTLTGFSLEVIGAAFGGREHGTVINAVKATGDRAATQPRFASELLDLRALCEEALKK